MENFGAEMEQIFIIMSLIRDHLNTRITIFVRISHFISTEGVGSSSRDSAKLHIHFLQPVRER